MQGAVLANFCNLHFECAILIDRTAINLIALALVLALLVAQLRNQDPTAPMDTTEMMAQSTQMASMEQLTSLTDTSRESFALQMRRLGYSMPAAVDNRST